MNFKVLIIILILLFIFSQGLAFATGNTKNQSFNKAKKLMYNKIYYDHRITFYCRCPYTNDRKIIPSNNYTPIKNSNRSKRTEAEHIIPAENFGRSFKSWREGDPKCVNKKGKSFKGRNCASKVSIPYRYMQSDLYFLAPAIGEVNMRRSNYSFAMIPNGKSKFGNCDMVIKNRKVQPPPYVRGNIARTYFYGNWAYPGRGIISRKNKKLFAAWDKQDPVDKWECTRAKRIERIQGNENPFVKQACIAKGWY